MSSILRSFSTLRSRLGAAMQTRAGRAVLRGLRLLFLGAIVAFLVYQLAEVGWRELWEGLPRTPWFYVISLVMYFVLPLTEALIYGRLWRVPQKALVGPSLRKRVLNADVVGYSGDVYLYLWATRRLGLPERPVWQALKDNALTSSAAAIVSAALLLAGLVATDKVAFLDLLGNRDPVWLAVGAGALVTVAVLGTIFRQRLFSLPIHVIGALLGVHALRFGVLWTLQILQWWVVLPEASFEVWGTMLVVQTVANRLPLLPARDLVGVGAILGMSSLLAASEAVIAGMLLTRSTLDRLLNALLFGASTLWERRHPAPRQDERPDGLAPAPLEESASPGATSPR